MAIKTLAEQLEAVQAAIEQIELHGESVAFNGRSMRRSDLAALYAREERLRIQYAREQRGGIRVRGVTPVA